MPRRRLEDAVLLQGDSRRGGGNRLYRFGDGDDARVLKMYRRRRDRWRSPFRAFGSYLEGKRGTSPEARYATERRSLTLWAQHGFDVPQTFDESLPEGIAPPALWMAYCPGPTLLDAVRSRKRTTDDVAAPIAAFAASLARRHDVAEREDEVLLIHEHPALVHVIVFGERLVSFDLEGGYRERYPVSLAIGFELAGLARTIQRADVPDEDALFDAFVAGYGDGLDARVNAATHRRGLWAWASRARGKLRQTALGKKTKQGGLAALQRAIRRRDV